MQKSYVRRLSEKEGEMIVKAIRCPKCGDVIYSRARHDMRFCSCKAIFIDGGFDYVRMGGKALEEMAIEEIEVNASRQDLDNDWNLAIDKYGVIKGDNNGR